MDSLGSLIDELSVVNIKIYHLIDTIEREPTDKIVAESARKAQILNRQRSKLINEINERLGQNEMTVKI